MRSAVPPTPGEKVGRRDHGPIVLEGSEARTPARWHGGSSHLGRGAGHPVRGLLEQRIGSGRGPGKLDVEHPVVSAQQADVRRLHAVPGHRELPDSDVMQPGDGIDPNWSQFQAAQKACRSLEPQGGPQAPSGFQLEALVMRSHGEPNFPDPSSTRPTGPVTTIFGISLPSGIDPQSPQFQAAVKACESELPGGPPKGAPKQNWAP
jgi:hypothetical protein